MAGKTESGTVEILQYGRAKISAEMPPQITGRIIIISGIVNRRAVLRLRLCLRLGIGPRKNDERPEDARPKKFCVLFFHKCPFAWTFDFYDLFKFQFSFFKLFISSTD